MSDNELLQAMKEIINSEVKEIIRPLENKIDNMDKRLSNVEKEVVKTNLIIENDIKPKIQLLAEGHKGLVERLWHTPDDIEEIKESISTINFIQREMAKSPAK